MILAAGASTRLGEPKQLVQLGAESLLERAIRIATEAGCSPVIVVLGASADLIQQQSNLHGAQVTVNDEWAEGMASSIRLGVSQLDRADGVVVMTCDMPAVNASHIQALARSGETTATSYAGRRGVPAYLPRPAFALLLQLRGDAGARDLLATASSIDLPGGELDIDTPEDLMIARECFG